MFFHLWINFHMTNSKSQVREPGNIISWHSKAKCELVHVAQARTKLAGTCFFRQPIHPDNSVQWSIPRASSAACWLIRPEVPCSLNLNAGCPQIGEPDRTGSHSWDLTRPPFKLRWAYYYGNNTFISESFFCTFLLIMFDSKRASQSTMPQHTFPFRGYRNQQRKASSDRSTAQNATFVLLAADTHPRWWCTAAAKRGKCSWPTSQRADTARTRSHPERDSEPVSAPHVYSAGLFNP